MKIKTILIIFLAAFVFTSCDKENKIGNPAELPIDVNIPQGLAPAATDQRIVDFFEKYNTFILYDYTPQQSAWKLVGSPMATDIYKVIKADPDKVENQLNMFFKLFVDFYSDEFLKKYLPYKVFFADFIGFNSQGTEPYYEWGATNAGTNLVVGYGRINTEYAVDTMYLAFDFIHRNFMNILFEGTKLTFPEEFFNYSNYTVSAYTSGSYRYPDEVNFTYVEIPSSDLLNNGLLGYQSSYSNADYNKRNDIRNYLDYMRKLSPDSEQWAYYLTFPKVKAKYDILVAYWVKTYGYDPRDLGRADFGTIVLP